MTYFVLLSSVIIQTSLPRCRSPPVDFGLLVGYLRFVSPLVTSTPELRLRVDDVQRKKIPRDGNKTMQRGRLCVHNIRANVRVSCVYIIIFIKQYYVVS